MAAENEIEELELQLESKVCGLGVDGLVELAEQLEVEAKELRKLALSKKSLRTYKTTKQENSWSLHLHLWMENRRHLRKKQLKVNR